MKDPKAEMMSSFKSAVRTSRPRLALELLLNIIEGMDKRIETLEVAAAKKPAPAKRTAKAGDNDSEE